MKIRKKTRVRNDRSCLDTRSKKLPFVYVLIRSWNAYQYFDHCVDSVLRQSYPNYQILFVDDASEYTIYQKKYITSKLKGHICVFNKKRQFPLRNAYQLINKFCTASNAIIFNLDGDDWLPHVHCLTKIAKVYYDNPLIQATYGDSYLYKSGEIVGRMSQEREYANVPYPPQVIKDRSFRTEPFIPHHPLTWRVRAFKHIPVQQFKSQNGEWLKYCQDQSIFFALLELFPDKIICLNTPLYVYNWSNQNSTNRLYMRQVIKEELYIRLIQKKL